MKVGVDAALSPGYRRITFVVFDDGIGMSEDYLEHLFEPFVIEGRSRSQGTGLGMSIVRNIVTAAGGDIHVETKLGEGTTFTIVMNRRVAPGGDGDLSSAGDRPRSANVDADGAVAGAVDGAAGAVGAVAGGGAGAAGGRLALCAPSGVPVVAMSANAFADDVLASLKSGMNAHLSKPIDIDEVIATLAREISARKAGV